MTNGEGTHEWRLQSLESRMDRVEGWVIRGALAAIGNLIAVGLLLLQAYLGK